MRRALNSTLLRQLGHGYYRKPLRRDGGTGAGEGGGGGGGGTGSGEGGAGGGNNTGGGNAGDKTFSQADLDRIVQERLARAKPADYDDLKTKAAKLDELEAANKTETQKLADERDKLAAENAVLKSKQVRIDAVEAVDGLTAADAEFITASDPAEAKKQAEKLAERLKPKSGAGGGNDQGHRRQPPASGRESGLAEAQKRFGKSTGAAT